MPARTPRTARWTCLLCAACGTLGLAAPDVFAQAPAGESWVLLRGSDPDRASEIGVGTVLRVGGAGVEVQDLSAPAGVVRARVLSWDQVASVKGALADEAAQYADLAKVAWRARTRMARGDVGGAEPLLETLFVTYRGQQGPTASMVASGLLRCRLARQAQSAAVEAWLALLAAESPEVLFESERKDLDVRAIGSVDTAWGLCPQLPPIWVPGPALRVVLGAIASDAHATTRAARIAQLYRVSALHDAGEAINAQELAATIGSRPTGDQGLELVWDVVASRSGSDQQRALAVRQLQARLAPVTGEQEPLPAWVQAWTRVALGRALIAQSATLSEQEQPEQREDARNLGIVQLLHVPARFYEVSDYLAGLALAEVSAALHAAGHIEDAARVRRLFMDRHAGHPAQAWLLARPASTSTGGAK